MPPTRCRSKARFPSLDGAVEWLNSPPLTAAALEGQGRAGRFLDLFLHQLPAHHPLCPRLGGEVQGPGPGRDRRACAGVRLREERRQRQARRSPISKIGYPVAIDNDYAIWRAFNNEYWPAHYFIDAKGRIRHHHFGEGDYDESEQVIQQLLAEAGKHGRRRRPRRRRRHGRRGGGRHERRAARRRPMSAMQRAENFVSPGGVPQNDQATSMRPRRRGSTNGACPATGRSAARTPRSNRPDGSIVYRFHARDLHLVLGPGADGKPVRFRVTIDGKAPGANHGVDIDADGHGTVTDQRLYQLVAAGTARCRRPHLRDPVPRSRRPGLRLHLRLTRSDP